MTWAYGETIGRRLLAWSCGSVLAGIVLVLVGDAWWRGFGVQALVWGAIDAAIAIGGIASARRGARRGAGVPGAEAREAAKLRRLLLVNGGLDVLYIAAGLILAGPIAAGDPFLAGNGWGVVVQGGFLLVFDVAHARRVPRPAGA